MDVYGPMLPLVSIVWVVHVNPIAANIRSKVASNVSSGVHRLLLLRSITPKTGRMRTMAIARILKAPLFLPNIYHQHYYPIVNPSIDIVLLVIFYKQASNIVIFGGKTLLAL
jgi:hypothetical protein